MKKTNEYKPTNGAGKTAATPSPVRAENAGPIPASPAPRAYPSLTTVEAARHPDPEEAFREFFLKTSGEEAGTTPALALINPEQAFKELLQHYCVNHFADSQFSLELGAEKATSKERK